MIIKTLLFLKLIFNYSNFEACSIKEKYMKKLFLGLSIFLGTFLLDAAYKRQECVVPNKQIDLIILNDPYGYELSPTETEFALVDELIKAFFSQAALVLVQTSIWQRFVQELDGEEVYAGLKKYVNDISFELYDLETAFVVIIPTLYKKQWGISDEDLPLNLSKLKKIDEPFAYKPLSSKTKISMVADAASLFFTEGFEKVPLPKALEILLMPSSEKNTYAWNFMIRGHGENFCFPKASFLVGIRQETFRKFLKFCQTGIKTNTVIYSTCSGGSKASLIDTYMTKGKPDRYSFPIFIAALGDALTFASDDLTLLISDLEAYKKDPQNLIDRWQAFFTQLHKIAICPRNAEKLVELLDSIYRFREFNAVIQKYVMRGKLNELIQARWAYSTKFEPLPLEHYIAIASKRIGATKSIFGPRITEQALILDKAYLDQPLILKAYNIVLKGYSPKVASNIPSFAYYISSIRAYEKYWLQGTREPLDFLLKAFDAIKGEQHKKLVLIERYDFGAQPGQEALEKVMIVLSGPSFVNPSTTVEREMFYIKPDGKAYVLVMPEKISTEVPLNDKQKAKYLKLFNDTKAQLAKEYGSQTPGLFRSFTEVVEEEPQPQKPGPKIIQRSRTTPV